jgi:hypothetical protein
MEIMLRSRFKMLSASSPSLAVASLRKHLHIGLAIDQHLHAMPKHGVVVDQHHSHFGGIHTYGSGDIRISNRTSVPPSGRDRNFSEARNWRAR